MSDCWTVIVNEDCWRNEELSIEDLDLAFSKLVGRGWDSWPPLYYDPWQSRHNDYLPLNLWDEIGG